MKLLNLDKFIEEKRILRLGGIDYVIPGLISVETVLKISKQGQDAASDPEKIIEALHNLWEILAPENKGKSEKTFISSISPKMLQELLPFIFNDQGGEEVESGTVDLSKNGSGGEANKAN